MVSGRRAALVDGESLAAARPQPSQPIGSASWMKRVKGETVASLLSGNLLMAAFGIRLERLGPAKALFAAGERFPGSKWLTVLEPVC